MAEPFLIGENMTGGYGAVDILHSCTLAVEPGEIAVIDSEGRSLYETGRAAYLASVRAAGGGTAGV